MGMKKKDIKPISFLRFDFTDSLENVCQQSIAMLQVVSTLLQQNAVNASVRDILQERHDALRKALIGDE